MSLKDPIEKDILADCPFTKDTPKCCLSTDDYTLINLENNQLYFTGAHDFNDPFDCRVRGHFKGTKEQMIKYFKENADDYSENDVTLINSEPGDIIVVNEFETEVILDVIKLPLTCCFTEDAKNVLMWSHYANHHKGICLRFKVEENQDSSEGKYLFNLNSVPMQMYQVRYNRTKDYPECVNFLDETHGEQVANFLITKLKCWCYEKEHRIILYDDATNIHKFDKKDLESIIFGCRIKCENAKKIRKIIEDNYLQEGYNVKFCKAVLDIDEINIIEIDNIDSYLSSLKDYESLINKFRNR
jgi:hypothetical protein